MQAEVNHRIAILWVNDATMPQIAEQLGITRSIVKTRIRRMQDGGEIPPARAHWSEAELAILRADAAIGCSDEAIARKLGRTTIAVIRQRGRLNIRRA